ncbi:GNAT family N-acetyltransferase [Phenylobacterium montanum]|uniref:GNAT family N-acetyltransferase n=1 Tax=Phenylobacterium montanum TaxID=2823693 RepID=A0A975G085_9CAUL|nr:GNAT family N-acetyltransferase [Caulobacter sp. S6]QUD88738.1 GNAT family N-acetyltransferase [Caulobacter sp. S6]
MHAPPEPFAPPAQPWFPLATERLLLREFRSEDLDDIHAYGSDPEMVRFMDWGPNTPQMTREFLDRMLVQQAEWPRLGVGLAVEWTAEARVIGAVRLEVKDPIHRTADLGYGFHREFWGRGVATEAARALVRVGFDGLGLHRIWATCDARNTGSQRVLEKLGMRREGLMNANAWSRDHWRDTLLYAVLAEEWGG